MGDANDPKGLGFYNVKQRKVKGRGTSPEGRAVLHQDVDKSLVYGQELRCAKEGLFTKEMPNRRLALEASYMRDGMRIKKSVADVGWER